MTEDLSHQARTAGFTADGLYEEAAPGGEYVTKCMLYLPQGSCYQERQISKQAPLQAESGEKMGPQ